ncbi:DMT family transporter [Desulfospira joergensenii]|uniref:DMT family transporter n=1 Tax=Desulfospira joergensenii TaxID=53329 RepID=UPI0003B48047|nr:DMT family transporter [Desulfospira joergensenii]
MTALDQEKQTPISMSLDTRHDLLPILALLAAVLFWGGSFVAMRVSVKVLHPQAVMFCRMAIACLAMLPFAGRLKPDKYLRGDLKLLLPMVLLQPCLYFLFESNALKLTTSSQAGVISASVPLLVGIGAWLFLSESISRRTIAGLIISVAGVALLTLLGEGSHPGDNPFWGNILEFLGMGCAAGSMVIVKQLSSRYNPWTLSGMQFLAGVLFFSPGIGHLMACPRAVFTGNLLLSLGFLGLFASLGAFGLYNWAMSRIPAARASVFINLVPVAAVIFGWTILGETLSLGQSGAAVMVAAGVIISQRTPKTKARDSLGKKTA